MYYTIHTTDTAPAEARDLLAGAARSYGFVPNLLGIMAEAPSLLEGYWTLSRLFEASSLSATERQIVLLTVSAENTCEYCIAAHTVIAGMQRVPRDVVDAIRDGHAIADAKLEALRPFTAAVVLRGAGRRTPRWRPSWAQGTASSRCWKSFSAWGSRRCPTTPITSPTRRWTRHSPSRRGQWLRRHEGEDQRRWRVHALPRVMDDVPRARTSRSSEYHGRRV